MNPQLISDWDEFLNTCPIFNAEKVSKAYRFGLTRTLQGLGLPTPVFARRSTWGYTRYKSFYVPIESDLLILLKAIELKESGEYILKDLYEWFLSTPITKKISFRQFQGIIALRPPFPELKLTRQERIGLLYGITPTSPEEIGNDKEAQASDAEGTQEAIRRDSSAEATDEQHTL